MPLQRYFLLSLCAVFSRGARKNRTQKDWTHIMLPFVLSAVEGQTKSATRYRVSPINNYCMSLLDIRHAA
jgi:hypothetical protein